MYYNFWYAEFSTSSVETSVAQNFFWVAQKKNFQILEAHASNKIETRRQLRLSQALGPTKDFMKLVPLISI